MQLSKAVIDAGRLEFAFADSGVPLGKQQYTTFVCFHGVTFSAGAFAKLFPLARESGLRIIAVNRRGYTGSTPFSEEEMKVLNDPDPSAIANFLRGCGLDIARFLVWIVQELKLPDAQGEGHGIVPLGWSLGNVWSTAFLRYFSTYPSSVRSTLKPFLRSFVIYETVFVFLGYPSPPQTRMPQDNPTLTNEERDRVFSEWASSYFRHPFYHSESNRERDPSNLTQNILDATEKYRPTSFELFTEEDIKLIVHAEAGHADLQLFRKLFSHMEDLKFGTFLLDSNNGIDNEAHDLADLKLIFINGDATVWSVIWATWKLEEEMDTWQEQGKRVRPTEFVLVPGANHFWFWDDPSAFVSKLSELV